MADVTCRCCGMTRARSPGGLDIAVPPRHRCRGEVEVARLEALTTTTPRADAPSGTIALRDGQGAQEDLPVGRQGAKVLLLDKRKILRI